MRKSLLLTGIGLFTWLGSVSGYAAYNEAEADALYNQRGAGAQAVDRAQAAYEEALGTTSGGTLFHAIERIGRLTYYKGEYLLPEQNAEQPRMAAYTQCLNDLQYISPDKVGETIQYDYWKSVCLALWAKSAGDVAALSHLSELKDTLNAAFAKDDSYEYYGIHVLYAGIYARDSKLWIAGLWDPEGSLSHVEKAIAMAPDHYEAYYYKGIALRGLNRKDEAIAFLQATKNTIANRIRSRTLPAGFEPETIMIYKQIVALLGSL